ncbi:MAG: dihydrodipicolinate synthase family protein [Spirochaetes bacterium]|nr:dihydrodipicolinate synthase family protein [Spirochaetota bacterium]
MQRIISTFPDKIVFIGHDEDVLSGLVIGAKAAIGSTFNFMAEKFIALQHHFQQLEIEQAQKLQRDANKIIDVLIKVGVFKGIKAILEMLGFPCGYCRKPFQPLLNEDIQLVAETIKTYR